MLLRILVVDDHPAIRRMLHMFLEHHADWHVCGEAVDGLEAVTKTTDLQPDIVLMDLDMPRLNGIEATRQIHKLSPSTRVLILTSHENSVLTKIAQDSGANGYVLKSAAMDVLTQAIESVETSDRFFVSNGN